MDLPSFASHALNQLDPAARGRWQTPRGAPQSTEAPPSQTRTNSSPVGATFPAARAA